MNVRLSSLTSISPVQVGAVVAVLREWGYDITAQDEQDLIAEFDVAAAYPDDQQALPGFRADDPSTSRLAALDAYPRTKSQRWHALLAVGAAGEHGATYADVMHKTGINGVWKRLSELKEAGWIEARGTRRVSETGSEADVYRLTIRAREEIARKEGVTV